MVQTSDESEFLLTVVDELDHEIASFRRNTKLKALFDDRSQQTETVPLDEVRRQLSLSD